jgi:CBS domain containing-hemolysin-like protein
MTDISGSRSPREDGADEQNSFAGPFRGWLRAILGGRGDTTLRDTIEELIEEGREAEGSIAAHERVLLANILKLRDRSVEDAMVPRADIVAVDIDTPLPALIQRISEEAHSRLPVYRETLDDVVGMVHIKDVLACVAQPQKDFDFKDIVRDVLIVAPSMPVLDLLLQMRQSRQHMALVVDEFGGIDGLVTIEDLVEEIVGEIEDEHDEKEAPLVVTRPDGSLLADARLPIDDFLSQVGPVLEEEEREVFDTLGGLVFNLAGRVPNRGEVLRHSSGLEFEVVDADPRRIKRLRVRNIPEPVDAAHG